MVALLDINVLRHALAQGAAYREISFASFSFLPLFFASLLVLSRRGLFVFVTYVFLGAFYLANGYAAYRWGVKLHTAVLGYALLITIASILVSSRFGLLVTGAVAAYIIPLWYLQFHGVLPTQAQTANATDAVVFSVMYGVIMVVAWLGNHEMERSLARARKSEAALKEERDLLDLKVEERTQELRQAQLEQVSQLHRFAEFGQLASGLFHDLANIVDANMRQGGMVMDSTQDAQLRMRRFMQAIRKQLDSQQVEESFSVTESLEQALQLLAYKALSRHVRVRFERPADSYMRFGDPVRFHQIVVNLLQNAIESFDPYKPGSDTADRLVDVHLHADDGTMILEIVDRGRGIPQELRAKVFEPFYTTRTDGLGIGLATVRRIVEEDCGGSITVSAGPHGGTLFRVTFPERSAA